jgi:N-hydroxyarylamine O-acetyltransferase
MTDSPNHADDWVANYLALLGLEREQPGLDYLRRLTRAHLMRVPFENITSILRRAAAGTADVPPVDRASELDAWMGRRGGGLCFEIADMFGTVLSELGFQTHRVLAVISFPGSHQGLVVRVGATRYLVDAGNGAPFFEPIPLRDGEPVEFSHVGLTYRFRPEAAECWVQDRLIDGAWRPFCTYDLAPADATDQQTAYQRHHALGQSWVVDTLTLIRCTSSDVWSLRDRTLNHFSAAGKSTLEFASEAARRQAIAEVFDLPNAPLSQAVLILDRSA